MGLNDIPVPLAGCSLGEFRQRWWDYLQDEKYQRKLVLVTVSIALLLDNMLLTTVGTTSTTTTPSFSFLVD